MPSRKDGSMALMALPLAAGALKGFDRLMLLVLLYLTVEYEARIRPGPTGTVTPIRPPLAPGATVTSRGNSLKCSATPAS